ncbi:MAG: hypothetical protein U0Y10_03390 [Spirosomataceae bacterium]
MEAFCILLTGNIAPSGVPNLVRSNPSERENDYVQSLTKWLETGHSVVFCENSGYCSTRISALFEKYPNGEFLQFATTQSHLGKGHGEAEIMEYAYRYSTKLQQHSGWIAKVTGRNFVENYKPIFSSVVSIEKGEIVANLEDNLRFADSRMFFFKSAFFESYLAQQLILIYEQQGIFFEHCLARAIHLYLGNGGNWYPLPIAPNLVGYYASANLPYKNDYFRKSKRRFIQSLRNWAIRYRPW